jgi:cytosine/adenosine deaminase-related metal-dependent hydrolase
VRYLDNLGALDLKPLLIHAVQVDADDIARIAASGSSVVHCPRSELRLGSGRFPLAAYLDAEVPVYLGTESRASSPSLNVLHDLDVAAALHYETVPPEALEALARRPLFSEA